jgi:hypothetical protein
MELPPPADVAMGLLFIYGIRKTPRQITNRVFFKYETRREIDT